MGKILEEGRSLFDWAIPKEIYTPGATAVDSYKDGIFCINTISDL